MKTTNLFSTMDFSVTDRRLFAQVIAEYPKFERNTIPFAVAGLNICFPNISKKEVNKIVKDNFRDEKDRILEKGSKYYILMNGSTIEVAERAVNWLKAKLRLKSRNLRLLRFTRRIQAAAFIFGTSRITKNFEYKYVDLNPCLNFFNKKTNKETHIIKYGFKEYLKFSVSRKTDNHSNNLIINISA